MFVVDAPENRSLLDLARNPIAKVDEMVFRNKNLVLLEKL
jgi:hypothetical protein